MKLKFDLVSESLRLKRDYKIDIPESNLLKEFNRYYSERSKDGCFFISLASSYLGNSIQESLYIDPCKVVGIGTLQEQSIIDINITNDNYNFFEEDKDFYTLRGRWLADKDGNNLKLISVHICFKERG
jgi:hypothetical protein